MARPRKNTEDIGPLMKVFKHFFGTPKTTYRVLCLEEVGITWSEFQYAWTHERTSKQVDNAIHEVWTGIFYALRNEIESNEDLLQLHPGEAEMKRAQYWYAQEQEDEP